MTAATNSTVSLKWSDETEVRITQQLNEFCFIAGKLHRRCMSWIDCPGFQRKNMRYEWLPVPSFETMVEADAS